MLSLKTNLWVNVSVDVTFPENVEYFKRFKFDQKSLKFLICDKVLTVSQFVSLVWQTFIISSEKSICVGGGSKKCETRQIENSIRNICGDIKGNISKV